MPLLKKKSLDKAPLPEFLRDDEEVFHCKMTNEIFRDYDEFADRTILCNSMVWTCSMTGKCNLTYLEASQSEKNALKMLKDFPMELKVPLLYLAKLTKRTSFTDMAEDIFSYIKDRYFVGENIEACFATDKWHDFHVLQVIAPTDAEMKKNKSKLNGNSGERNFVPDASLYKYDLEQLDAEDQDISEKMLADMSQMRRKKSQYSKEKSKLFLKQYVEQSSSGFLGIKDAALESFGINKVQFNQIFDGPLPDFGQTNKTKPKAANGKKVRQETLAKYLTKTTNGESNGTTKNKNNASLIEKMKKMEAEFKQKREEMKLKSLETVKAEKERVKLENMKLAVQLKEWYKPRDDLELEDQKRLPETASVLSRIPDKYVGDALCVMEFLKSFADVVKTKDYFPNGVGFDVMEKILLEKDVAGPFIDMLQLLLDALFRAQEEETRHYTTVLIRTKSSDIPDLDDLNNLTPLQITKLANVAYKWTIKHQGVPYNKLPLCPVTVTEILRLHLLTSGVRLVDMGTRWRFAQRGGYTSEDDPAIHLRMHHPHILKALALHNVVQLPISDKLKVLNCLVNQLLTYTDLRDVIEERIYNARNAKVDSRNAAALDKKRLHEFITTNAKIKKGEITDPGDIDKFTIDNDKKQDEFDTKIKELNKISADVLVLLGYDRGFRRYIKLESVPGLFVNTEDENSGTCINEPICQNADLLGGERKAIVTHLNNIKEEMNTSDKENEPKNIPPRPKPINGLNNDVKIKTETPLDDLYMCSADPSTCSVHSTHARVQWAFYYKKEHIDELIESLNKRGVRENELLQVLQNDYDSICNAVERTPCHQLNSEKFVEDKEKDRSSRNGKRKTGNVDTNLGYPDEMPTSEVMFNVFLENLFDLEEKLHIGNLGGISDNVRKHWKECLQEKKFNEMDTRIVKNDDDKQSEEEGSRPTSPVVAFKDPGCFVGCVGDVESEDSDMETDQLLLCQTQEDKIYIKYLAIALAQIAYSIKKSVFNPPLGGAKTTKPKKDKSQVINAIGLWETSLKEATSYSQLFLHYCTLDSCVLWSRSALLAKCRICRRGTCPDQMLLCDGCNLGHHMYCLKPKLNKVPAEDWFCYKCIEEKEKETKENPEANRRRIFLDDDDDVSDADGSEQTHEEDEAVEEEESDVEMEEPAPEVIHTCTTCGSGGELLHCCEDNCSLSYHIECIEPPLRRAPRGPWTCNSCKEARDDPDQDEVTTSSTRRSRRDIENRDDLPLHNAPLQELLSDVMKHKDAWAFIRPVAKIEVPDYYEVIEKPMDFGTIKYKLNMGKYNFDAEVMADAVLVFENCNTYNNSEAEVYKCGVKLLKYYSKRCKELNLKTPEEMQMDEPKSKKRRTK